MVEHLRQLANYHGESKEKAAQKYWLEVLREVKNIPQEDVARALLTQGRRCWEKKHERRISLTLEAFRHAASLQEASPDLRAKALLWAAQIETKRDRRQQALELLEEIWRLPKVSVRRLHQSLIKKAELFFAMRQEPLGKACLRAVQLAKNVAPKLKENAVLLLAKHDGGPT